MTKSRTARALALLCGLTLVALAGGLIARATSNPLAASDDAWQRGDYITALNGYIAALNAPGGDALVSPIAQTTGELYMTVELTDDGRAGRFSPDGHYIVYETGLETSRGSRILRNDAARTPVATLNGISVTFSPDGRSLAYLRVRDTEDVRAAARALDQATLTQANRNVLVQTLTWTIARDSAIVVRDMTSGFEIELPTPVMVKSSLQYAPDGRSIYFLGAKDDNDTQTDIYRIAETSDGPTLAVDARGLKSAPLVAENGTALVYVIPGVSPLRRPAPPQPQGGGRGAAPAAPPRTPSTFAIVDLPTGRVTVVTGTAPTLSRDGRMLAYITREGPEYVLMVGPTNGMQAAVKRTLMRLDAPALSDEGARVAWQMMPRDDWEIFVANVAGSVLTGERRITREIQHDVLPRFLTSTRLLATIGEPRHRRAYLYDLSADGIPPRTRLFHNNAVRTIAPEYQWAPSPDGSQLIIGAERDGDTVSPQRGVYVVDMRRTVTKADVLARLRANLKSETALKAAGVHAFQPIAADVRRVVGKESVERVYGYEKALYDFDSKNITKPGNRLASEFLFNTYKSFGYSPEYQWFEPRGAFEGKTANVVATLRGTVNPELVYVISSHFDSVEAGPGADDDTSGTAALLEAARVLADHPLPATVMFASMTGEEGGLLGSREFVRRAVDSKLRIVGALNNDMVGWMNDQRMDNTIRYSNPGIRDIQHGAAMLFTKLITFDALYWKGTDAMSFYDVYGDVIGGIGSYPVLGSPYYHQSTDLLENENHQLIVETSKTTVATIMLLASSPSRLTKLKVDSVTNGTAALSWARSPEKGVASYIVAYGPESSPFARRVTTTQPHVVLSGVGPGTVVSVKGVNTAGLEGWDWARTTISKPSRPSTTP